MEARSLLRTWQTWAVAGVVVMLAAMPDDGHEPTDDPSSVASEAMQAPGAADLAPDVEVSPEHGPSPERAASALLVVTDQKDGDSFVASDGNEYRLGLVNTAEASEPCGPAAARFTRNFLVGGFTVDSYARDTYGRHVAEVFDPSGRSLNVALAESGYGDDRYLNQFRHENPGLARRLEAAFATAATPSCANVAPAPLVQQPAPAASAGADCHPGYDPCLPVRGDVNCPEVNGPVRVLGGDPYGLDRDGDGIGCD